MTVQLSIAMTGESGITFTRQFAAAPALVWRAMTDPAIVPRWLWARDYPMVHCQMDLRVGGSFRWIWRTSPTREMGVSGIFLTIDAPRRLTHTELFDEDWTGGETTVTQDLAEIAPRITRLTMLVRYPTPEARAAAAATPMAAGMEEGYARLDDLLPILARET